MVFDGTANTIVDLRTNLQCVQGNNPRSISFMIQTTYGGCSFILSTGQDVSGKMFAIIFSCAAPTGIIQFFLMELVDFSLTLEKW